MPLLWDKAPRDWTQVRAGTNNSVTAQRVGFGTTSGFKTWLAIISSMNLQKWLKLYSFSSCGTRRNNISGKGMFRWEQTCGALSEHFHNVWAPSLGFRCILGTWNICMCLVGLVSLVFTWILANITVVSRGIFVLRKPSRGLTSKPSKEVAEWMFN